MNGLLPQSASHGGPDPMFMAVNSGVCLIVMLIILFGLIALKSKEIKEGLGFAKFGTPVVLIVGLLLMSLLFPSNYNSPVETIRHYDIFERGAVGLSVAVLLFWIRENLRLLYGLLELGVAVVMLCANDWLFGTDAGGISKVLTYMGAIYVAIRGMTNLNESKALTKLTARFMA